MKLFSFSIKIITCVCLIFLFLVILGFTQKVKIERIDGVVIVKNPKKPVKVPGAPTALILEEDLRIGVGEGKEEYMFANLRSVQVDNDENIYVLDQKFIKVRVYDKDGKHIRSFGTQGQGPGEFERPFRMIMTADEKLALLDTRNNRFSYFSKAGECLREINLGKQSMVIRAWPDSQGNVYGHILEFTESSSKMLLIKFDADFNRIMNMAEMEGEAKIGEFNPIEYSFVYNIMPDDRIIWANNQEYCIHVLSSSGNLLKKIYKDYDQVTIPKKYKDKITKGFADSGMKVVFPKNYPPIHYLLSDSNGKVFIGTYEQDKDGLFKWDVFDKEGRYILSFFHPEEDILYTVRKDKVYSLNMINEEGIPHIRRYQMVWN